MAQGPGQPAENQGGGTISLQLSQAVVPRDAGSLGKVGSGKAEVGSLRAAAPDPFPGLTLAIFPVFSFAPLAAFA